MNFGFNFEDQQEDLNKINQNFYRKLLEDKLKLISGEDFGKDDKNKKKDDDSDSDDDDDDKNTKKATVIKDGSAGLGEFTPGKKE